MYKIKFQLGRLQHLPGDNHAHRADPTAVDTLAMQTQEVEQAALEFAAEPSPVRHSSPQKTAAERHDQYKDAPGKGCPSSTHALPGGGSEGSPPKVAVPVQAQDLQPPPEDEGWPWEEEPEWTDEQWADYYKDQLVVLKYLFKLSIGLYEHQKTKAFKGG